MATTRQQATRLLRQRTSTGKQKPGRPFGSTITKSLRQNDQDLLLESVGKRVRDQDRPFYGESLRRGKVARSVMHEKQGNDFYWISCRFCTAAVFEKDGISKVMMHERIAHPDDVDRDKQLPFYKIFKLDRMEVNVFPTHPFLQKILKHNRNSMLLKNSRNGGEPKVKGRGRGRHALIYSHLGRTCPHCDRKFKYPCLLNQHVKSCTERPTNEEGRPRQIADVGPKKGVHKCPRCPRSFQYPSFLKQHMKTCTGILKRPLFQPLPCNYCGKVFMYPGMLMRHKNICQLRLVQNKEASNKSDNLDKQQKFQNQTAQAKLYLTCELCPHISWNRMDLEDHRREIHNINTPPNELNSTNDNISHPRVDLHPPNTSCGSQINTSRQENLEEQEHVIQPTEIQAQYNCRYCLKSFPTVGKVALHERQHTGEKPFQCSYCPKKFGRASTHNRHQKLHEGINYPGKSMSTIISNGGVKCRYCPILLATKQGRTLHENYIHLNKRQSNPSDVAAPVPVVVQTQTTGFKCRFCNMFCGTLTGRALHEKSVHKEELRKAGTDEHQKPTAMEFIASMVVGRTDTYMTVPVERWGFQNANSEDNVALDAVKIERPDHDLEEGANPELVIVSSNSVFNSEPTQDEVDPLQLQEEAEGSEFIPGNNDALAGSSRHEEYMTPIFNFMEDDEQYFTNDNEFNDPLGSPQAATTEIRRLSSDRQQITDVVSKIQRCIYKCTKCKMLFNDKSSLAQHYANVRCTSPDGSIVDP